MRKLLMSMSFAAGSLTAASAAHAAGPVKPLVAARPTHVQPAQFYGGWREQEWRRLEAHQYWRRRAELRREAERREEWRQARPYAYGGYGYRGYDRW